MDKNNRPRMMISWPATVLKELMLKYFDVTLIIDDLSPDLTHTLKHDQELHCCANGLRVSAAKLYVIGTKERLVNQQG